MDERISLKIARATAPATARLGAFRGSVAKCQRKAEKRARNTRAMGCNTTRRAPAARSYVGLGLTQLSNYLTLKGSFSAVSKPNFARKYALENSRRNLQNALLCTVLVGSVWVHRFGIESQKPGKPWGGEKILVQTPGKPTRGSS